MKIKLAKIKRQKRIIRHKRARKKIKGTKERPRLCVFRSNKHIYAQIIDDEKSITLVSASDFDLKGKDLKRSKIEKAFEVGKILADRAKKNNIKKVVFDRGGYKFYGRIKSLAEALRKEGLKF